MKKGKTNRRLLALVLCLAMLFSCVPQGALPVLAAGNDTVSQGQPETGETTTPTEPEVTTEPTEPEATTEPTVPEDTTAPTEPEATTEPTVPEDTTAPTEPEVTTEPTQPEDTTAPTEPEVTTEPTEPAQSQNSAAPLAGEVVARGVLTDTITYTITEEVDPDSTRYHVLTLEGTGAMPDYTYSTYKKTPWYPYGDTLRQVVLGDGITSVGAYAFYNTYQKLVNLQLPSTLITIGNYAFYNCSGLTGSLDFSGCPALTTIGSYAFSDCTGLTGSLDFSGCPELTTIGSTAFQACTGITTLNLSCPKLTTIGSYAFSDCTGLTTLNLSCPALTTIGSSAFLDCTDLTGSLDFSGCPKLTTIGSSAFSDCTGLTGSLDLSGCPKLTTIGSSAFSDCTGLTTLNLSCPALTTIGDYAFDSCTGLTTLNLSCPKLTTIGDYAFYRCTGLTGSLDFSRCPALTSIGSSAFRNCSGLTTLNLSCPALTTIGSYAFFGCTGLTGSLDFSGCPELTTIGSTAFQACTGITTLNLSCPALTTIGGSAFYYCTGLTTLNLSSPKLTTIGDRAFSGCTGLTDSLDFSGCPALTTIRDRAFSNCTGITTLNLSCPALTTIGVGAFRDCTGLTTLNLSCPALTTIDSYAFSDCTGLTGSLDFSGCPALTTIGDRAFFGCTGLTTLNLSSPELTTIGRSAFDYCTGLTTLNLSCPKLTTIGDSAFSRCTGLTGSLDFSGCQALTTIGDKAFFNCTGLTGSLDFSGCPALTTIGDSAFFGCTGLTGSLDFSGCPELTTIDSAAFQACTGLTTLNLSCPKLTTIGSAAFRACTGITTLNLSCPKLTTIGIYAFSNCTGLTTLNLSCPKLTTIGTEAFRNCTKLNTITVEDGNKLTQVYASAFTGTAVTALSLVLPDRASADGVVRLLTALPERPQWLTLVGDSTQSMCFSQDFLEEVKDTRYRIAFAPGFLTFCPGDFADITGAAPLNTLKGSAWVDAQGVVYLLDEDSKTASLAYIPSDFKSYTVPATVGEGERSYNLSSVSSNALARAYQLGEITFADSKAVALADFALAGCPTLTSVNKETTVEGAKNLFKSVGKSAFLNTGLQEESSADKVSLGTSIQVLQEADATFTLSAQAAQPIENDVTGTGNTVTITAYIDGDGANAYQYRIYFLVSGGQFDMGGFQMNIDQEYTDNGIRFTLRRYDGITGLYYVDVSVPVGATWNRQFFLNYPALTPGGAVLVWAEAIPAQSSSDIQVLPQGQYYHFTWETESVPYTTMSVINNTNSYSYTRPSVGALVTLSPDLSWQIKLTAGQRDKYASYTSLAQDPARQAVHTMTFTLPEGLSWNNVLTEEVQLLTPSGDYWCLEGTPILKASPDSNTYVQKVTAVIADGELVLTLWQAAKGQALPTNPYLNLTLAQSVVQVPDEKGFNFNDSYGISLQVGTKLVYTFDQSVSWMGSAQWSSTPPKENLTYEKNRGDLYILYVGTSYYRLKAANDTIFNHTLTKISDPLPMDLFITPQGIRELFTLSGDELDNQTLAKYLTLTISNARQYHYDGDNALGYVTLTDGKTQHLLTAEMTDEYGTAYTDGVKVTIKLGTTTGTLQVAFGDAPSEEVPMDNLEEYLKTRGLALLSNTRYTVTWDFGAEHKILSGDTYLLQIPVEPKDSFQLLTTDWPIYRGASTSSSPSSYSYEYISVGNNVAYFEDPASNTKSAAARYYRDYAIDKSVSTNTVQNGGIVDYSVKVYRDSGSPREAGLPVVDAVSGTVCLLAPVYKNQGRPWAESTSIYTASDGTQYYLLELPDSARESGRYTYDGVWMNGNYANSVTVVALDKLTEEEKAKYNHSDDYSSLGNALADDGYLTEIRWYLASTTDSYNTLTYSVLVDVAYSLRENSLSGSVCNIAYLNDRDNHRLFDSTGIIPIYTITGNKELLDESGQVLGNNSTISAGETVHYRLTVNNLISRNMTIDTQDIADVLPRTYDVFAWSEDNVKLRYGLKSGGAVQYFSWEISHNQQDGTVIHWPEGLQVPANDTLYIYVDITFPSDTSGEDSLWKSYCDQVGSDTLVNSFRLVNMTYSVTHNLALPGSAYIQKGVASSQYYYGPSKVGEKMDLRYYSEPGSGNRAYMKETFYIVLYNAGPGPLYLTQLEDHFPAGAVTDASHVELITDKTYLSDLPQGLTLVQASITYQSSNSSVIFTFGSGSAEAGVPAISYDAAVRAYYLQPNQAIAFSYECSIGTDLDNWENTVAMPLHDPLNAGVGVAQISQIHYNYEMDSKTGNDGSCTYWTVEEGSALGYDSKWADEGWIASSVPLRKETVAGLEKQVVQRRSTSDVISPYNGYALPLDSLQWELTVYNDGSNIIDGFTITDTFPDCYTLAEGEVVISGVNGSSQNKQTLFEIEEVKTGTDGLVESVTLSDRTVISVEGENVSTKEYDISLYYNEDEQLVMELTLHLSADNGVIFPGKNVKLTYWTKNYTKINTYTTYVNSAVLTTQQELNYDKVSHGRVEWDENGEPAGILARAIAVTAGGYSTGSEKAVTEVGIPGNTASSNQIGSITLTQTDGGYSHFTYELQVDNSATGAKGMKWITLIDNLPQLDDTMTLNPKNQRGSEFQVEFAADPRVKVWYVTEEWQEVDITSKAMIQYSDKVTFGSGDWGKVGSIPESDGWGASSAGARSIRIYIPSDGETPAVPAGATLHVSFECQVKMDASVAPGHTAWNSFGYRYQMQNDQYYLEAAPLEVGVRIPDYPRIQKVLTDETGEAVIAEKDTEFYFLVYKGDKISGDFATGAALLQALMDKKTDFSIVKVTVPQGQSQVELKLEDLKICTYTPEKGWEETANPWVWTDGGSYTVVELGDQLTVGLGSYKDYQFASLDYVPDNSYTFQYNKSTSQLIRGENTLALRKLQIQKVDQADQSQKLPGAVFGLYSPNTSDQLTGDTLQTAATALELTTGQIQELEGKLIITHNGKNYYLYRLGKTDKNGLVTWDDLPGMTYCYMELWAPEGYYITEKDPVLVSFDVQGEYLRSVTHTVTNKQIVYLPKTGGMGRWQIPALGLLLCAAVVTVFLGKRRKKAA